jgi:hypothetical protein
VGKRLSISLGRYATDFQAETYAFLVCAHEIQLHGRSQKYESMYSDSQSVLNALQATRTTFALVQPCQKASNNIFTRHAVGLYCVPGYAGVRENEIFDMLARDGSVQKFVGPEPAFGKF